MNCHYTRPIANRHNFGTSSHSFNITETLKVKTAKFIGKTFEDEKFKIQFIVSSRCRFILPKCLLLLYVFM